MSMVNACIAKFKCPEVKKKVVIQDQQLLYISFDTSGESCMRKCMLKKDSSDILKRLE